MPFVWSWSHQITMNKILALYNEISAYKPISLSELVEQRLNLLLHRYEEDLQESFENLQTYDYLDLVKEVTKNAKFN